MSLRTRVRRAGPHSRERVEAAGGTARHRGFGFETMGPYPAGTGSDGPAPAGQEQNDETCGFWKSKALIESIRAASTALLFQALLKDV